jgi:hypothetical protein
VKTSRYHCAIAVPITWTPHPGLYQINLLWPSRIDRAFLRRYARSMNEIERQVPAGLIEQWAVHLRRQRSRAADTIWLLDNGFTVHDGRNGVPSADASARVRAEQEAVVAEVSALLDQYDAINLRGSQFP